MGIKHWSWTIKVPPLDIDIKRSRWNHSSTQQFPSPSVYFKSKIKPKRRKHGISLVNCQKLIKTQEFLENFISQSDNTGSRPILIDKKGFEKVRFVSNIYLSRKTRMHHRVVGGEVRSSCAARRIIVQAGRISRHHSIKDNVHIRQQENLFTKFIHHLINLTNLKTNFRKLKNIGRFFNSPFCPRRIKLYFFHWFFL